MVSTYTKRREHLSAAVTRLMMPIRLRWLSRRAISFGLPLMCLNSCIKHLITFKYGLSFVTFLFRMNCEVMQYKLQVQLNIRYKNLHSQIFKQQALTVSASIPLRLQFQKVFIELFVFLPLLSESKTCFSFAVWSVKRQPLALMIATSNFKRPWDVKREF